MSTFFVGLDLGQASDPTALAAVERLDGLGGGNADYHVRHVERAPLGTPYPRIISYIASLLAHDELRDRTSLVVDATGVGAPVVDMLVQSGLSPVAVTITAGEAVTRDGAAYRVPKRDLASVLQVLLQCERLKIADAIPEARLLVQEMLAFRVKITANAQDTYGAWRGGAHDDLVLAVALACWYGQQYTPPAAARVLPRSAGSTSGAPGGIARSPDRSDPAAALRPALASIMGTQHIATGPDG